jgi:hypothetical protein
MRYSTFSREAREAMERGMRVFVSLRDETFIGLILSIFRAHQLHRKGGVWGCGVGTLGTRGHNIYSTNRS